MVNGVPFHFRLVAPEEETGYADLAIVITKITGLSQALEDMRRQIGPDTIIMSPLNGVESEERVAAVYGWGPGALLSGEGQRGHGREPGVL